MKLTLSLTSLLVAAVLAGCSSISMPWSSNETESDPTAEAIFKEAETYFNKENYIRAIDLFKRVTTEYPFSPFVTPAELKIAEAYYLDKEYPEAVTAFKDFQARPKW